MAVGVHRGRHHRLLLGPCGRAGSRDEIAAWLEENFAFVTVSQHFITNIEYSFEGDRAQVRAMFYNPMQFVGGMTELSTCGGNYYHSMVRTETGWRSERLHEESLWFVNSPLGQDDD